MQSILKTDVRQKFNNQKLIDLFASLFIDAIGSLSYIIPGFAEAVDIVVAPCSALAIYAIHGSKTGAIVGFIEELLPFTDFVPTATTIWVKRYITNEEKTYSMFESNLRKSHIIIDRRVS